MTHNETPRSPQQWHPSAAMDGVVICGLFLICAGFILALAGPPHFQKEGANTSPPALLAQQDEALPDIHPGALTTTSEYLRSEPELFPAPASGVAPQPTPSEPSPLRLPTPSWGLFSKPSRSHKSGSAFVTLLGDRMNSATFRSSPTGSEANFIRGIWTPRNVKLNASGATLWLKKSKKSDLYTQGEMQTRSLYGYGRYEVVMRPAEGSGTVSSFFTYSGPHMGVPHDEIDIEFLGADTTKIHFNYFHRGKHGDATIYDLPFDAAEANHLYSFEWTPDHITWFVDGVPRQITETKDPLIPTYPGKIMFSLWTGIDRVRDWHGTPNFGESTFADYACISFTPLGDTARSCSDIFIPPAP